MSLHRSNLECRWFLGKYDLNLDVESSKVLRNVTDEALKYSNLVITNHFKWQAIVKK